MLEKRAAELIQALQARQNGVLVETDLASVTLRHRIIPRERRRETAAARACILSPSRIHGRWQSWTCASRHTLPSCPTRMIA